MTIVGKYCNERKSWVLPSISTLSSSSVVNKLCNLRQVILSLLSLSSSLNDCFVEGIQDVSDIQ